jgi:hypothetical protein
MIGSSTGLPLKLSSNGYVNNNVFTQFFISNLESFPGNSGGPVFDKAGFIEGIHVRGSVDEESQTGDYKFDETCNCVKLVQWDWPYGIYRGAQAQRITEVPFDLLLMAIYENIEYAITSNNQDRLEKWLVYQGMVEHEYTVEKGRFEFIAAKANNLAALKAIMQQTADVNIHDDNGRNLLYHAIINNNHDMVKFLLDMGVNPAKADSYNETPLHWAVSYEQDEVVKLLLSRGANPNTANMYGETPLHLAARQGNQIIAQYLIDKGADLYMKNNKGYTPRKVAKKSKSKAMAKFLKKAQKAGS